MQNTNADTEEIVENGGYISKLFLNNGKEIEIKENDIVLFVGPNNVGKSQALKDIYEICDTKKPSIVVKDIEIVKHNGDIKTFLETVSTVKDYGCTPRPHSFTAPRTVLLEFFICYSQHFVKLVCFVWNNGIVVNPVFSITFRFHYTRKSFVKLRFSHFKNTLWSLNNYQTFEA